MTHIQKIVSTGFMVLVAFTIGWLVITQLDPTKVSASYDANNLNLEQLRLRDDLLAMEDRNPPVEFRSSDESVLYCTDKSGSDCQNTPFEWWGPRGAQLTEAGQSRVAQLTMVAPPNWYALFMGDQPIPVTKYKILLFSLGFGLGFGLIKFLCYIWIRPDPQPAET